MNVIILYNMKIYIIVQNKPAIEPFKVLFFETFGGETTP